MFWDRQNRSVIVGNSHLTAHWLAFPFAMAYTIFALFQGVKNDKPKFSQDILS
jgi:hypothetical protein